MEKLDAAASSGKKAGIPLAGESWRGGPCRLAGRARSDPHPARMLPSRPDPHPLRLRAKARGARFPVALSRDAPLAGGRVDEAAGGREHGGLVEEKGVVALVAFDLD